MGEIVELLLGLLNPDEPMPFIDDQREPPPG